MIRAAVMSLVLAVSASAADIDVGRFLDAVRQVEEWNGRDGRAGERGPWQITAAVWSMHMPGISFAQARQEGPARACAVKHVAWLRSRLRAQRHGVGVADNAFNLALCWNAGFSRTITGRAPLDSYDYARRVQNLYLNP